MFLTSTGIANPAGAIYGVIAVSALLAAESPQRETYARTVGAVLLTLFLYWLAHSYAEFAGARLENEERLTAGGLAREMRRELSLLGGASVPLVPLVLWWVTGGPLIGAVTAAVWTSAAVIVLIEVVAGVRARLTGGEFVKQVGLGVLLGALVVAVKVLLH